MATPAQILSNRENAQHSTGPVTVQGKARSASNATKHGLSSAFTVLPNEDPDEYDEIFNGFIEEFDPAGYHETFLVHQMIQSRWRIIRIHRLERVYLEQLQVAGPTVDPDQAILDSMAAKGVDVLNAFARYTAAAERSYFKAHRELIAGRQAAAQLETAEARRAAADARREIAETERAINEYISYPIPQRHLAKEQLVREREPSELSELTFETTRAALGSPAAFYKTNPVAAVESTIA